MKETPTSDDLNTFKLFMGFEFKPENKIRLKDETDRFRTIENFLKGTTDSNDTETINLAAILVDFKPRPFLKFVKLGKNEEDILGEDSAEDKELGTSKPESIPEKKETSLKKKLIFGLIGFTGLFSIGYTAKDLVLPEKECMQWQNDHYEPIDCKQDINGFFASSPIVPFDEKSSTLRRLIVSDTTTFFEGKKAIIWYCKVGKEDIECFDGPGFHPVTGKALKPITEYIIDKYVFAKN
nr:hypothetical protein [uncultured Flavobacterium sp.]